MTNRYVSKLRSAVTVVVLAAAFAVPAGPSAAGPSATCVNQLNPMIKDRKILAFKVSVAQKGSAEGLLLQKFLFEADEKIKSKANQCLELAKQEALDYVMKRRAARGACRVAPDNASMIQCKNVTAYSACLKVLPYSPQCGVWNGKTLAACCNLHGGW